MSFILLILIISFLAKGWGRKLDENLGKLEVKEMEYEEIKEMNMKKEDIHK